jgi:hypothetical protein
MTTTRTSPTEPSAGSSHSGTETTTMTAMRTTADDGVDRALAVVQLGVGQDLRIGMWPKTARSGRSTGGGPAQRVDPSRARSRRGTPSLSRPRIPGCTPPVACPGMQDRFRINWCHWSSSLRSACVGLEPEAISARAAPPTHSCQSGYLPAKHSAPRINRPTWRGEVHVRRAS